MKTAKILLIACMLFLSGSLLYAGTVNINKADAETLAMELTGIGAKKAQAIIAYRNENGDFKVIEELARVKGISTKTIEKNRANILLVNK
jgi:competence protein ComEA